MLLIKITAIWLLMVVAAIVNGTFRDFVLNKYLPLNVALPLSGVFLSILIGLISTLSMRFIDRKSIVTYLGIGMFWVTLTLVFEYTFGFAKGMSFSEISQVFNVLEGNLFSLVLLVTLLSPVTVALLKRSVTNT